MNDKEVLELTCPFKCIYERVVGKSGRRIGKCLWEGNRADTGNPDSTILTAEIRKGDSRYVNCPGNPRRIPHRPCEVFYGWCTQLRFYG